ncbi:MAG: neutral zinc metallopeptidase [Jatrophihabitantaceae bacterium]
MQFNDDAQLDTSQVQDARGGGMGRGGLAVGGGGLGLVGLIAVVLFNVLGGGGGDGGGGLGGLSSLGQGSNPSSIDNTELSSECRTGADANERADCAIVADIDSVQAFWATQLPREGTRYSKSPTVFFTGQVNTGCGAANSGVGPFYCPADAKVYIDLAFFEELRTQFGATGGAFPNAYVIAHEYGHHVQDLMGTSDRVNHGESGPTSDTVRLELQADCYAGVWANHATTTPSANGRPFIENLSQADIDAALDTASRIGDDWIQSHLGSGGVDESKFTHGSSAQRQKWFGAGYKTGDPARCDTFETSNLG